MLRIYIVFPLYINILPSTPLCIVKHVYNMFNKCHSNSWHQFSLLQVYSIISTTKHVATSTDTKANVNYNNPGKF